MCVWLLGSLAKSLRANTKMSVNRGLIRTDKKNHASPLLPLLPAMKATTNEKSNQNKKTSILTSKVLYCGLIINLFADKAPFLAVERTWCSKHGFKHFLRLSY
jgi:hypothetical protein